MKTKNLFLVTMAALFGAVVESSGQNYSEPASAGDGGYNNVFLGPSSGANTTSTSGQNAAVGFFSLKNNTIGAFNTALGAYSLTGNTSGNNNVAIGRYALGFNVDGSENIAISGTSLEANVSGNGNMAIGKWALRDNIEGSNNIGFGNSAGKGSKGNFNCYIGEGAGISSSTGSYNYFSGFYSGYGVTSGENNLFIGRATGYSPTPHSSTNNTYIGYTSGQGVLTGNYNTFLGSAKVVPNSPSTASLAGTDTSNTIILADGEGNQRLFIHGGDPSHIKNGYTGIALGNNQIPQNRLEINSVGSVAGTTGLRFRGFNNTLANPNGKVLTLNSNGDVVLTTDQGSGGSTLIQAGTNVTVNGSGVVGDPYTIAACNLYSCDGTLSSNRLVNMNNNHLIFNTGGSTTTTGGRVYIGNTSQFTSGAGGNFVTFNDINPENVRDYRLYVEGGLLTERVKVALRNTGNWADYVFNKDYKLMPLSEVEVFVKENNHLPGIDSANDLVKKGLDVAEMQAKQMAKIEELTLYVIDQNKEIEELKAQVKALLERK